MIRAAGQAADGTPLLILGLSWEDMAALTTDQPIVLDTSGLGIEPGAHLTVILVGGRTEQDITRKLQHDFLAAALSNPGDGAAHLRIEHGQ